MPKPNPYGFPGLQKKHGKFCYQPPMRGGLRPRLIHLSTESMAEAVRMADAIRRKQFFAESTEPLAALADAFLTAKAAEGEHKSAVTTATARAALRRFQGAVKCPPREISTAKIREWKAAMLAEGLSRASVSGYMRYAQSFCTWLEREGKVLRNPFAGEKNLFPKSIPTRRGRVCDKATRDRLIAECDYPPLKAVLYIGFHAGLRKNEILNIRPDWISRAPDGTPTHIHIRNERGADGGIAFAVKDSEAKTVPVSTPLALFLRDEYGLDHSPYLIRPDKPASKYRYRWEWKRRWATYMRAQGVPWVTVHTMRHTWFTLLLSAPPGTQPSLLHLERWSGTSAETIKKHYAHLVEDSNLINAAN